MPSVSRRVVATPGQDLIRQTNKTSGSVRRVVSSGQHYATVQLSDLPVNLNHSDVRKLIVSTGTGQPIVSVIGVFYSLLQSKMILSRSLTIDFYCQMLFVDLQL